MKEMFSFLYWIGGVESHAFLFQKQMCTMLTRKTQQNVSNKLTEKNIVRCKSDFGVQPFKWAQFSKKLFENTEKLETLLHLNAKH